MTGKTESPKAASYDVVIIGGAIMGSSTAWFLTDNKDFNGKILVIERDMTYSACSTAHTNSCIRQQYSTALNVRVSQFGAAFYKDLRARMGGDPRVPQMKIHSFGYLYLADTTAFADVLRDNQVVQNAAGAATMLMTAQEIKADYPFYNVDDIVLGSINKVDEGYFDGATMFDWWKRQARERGVEYIENEVVGITRNAAGNRVESVTLKSGEVIGCGQVVNASGPRAALTAAMAGITVPVEPRKRFTWIFQADKPLDRDLPLTIDPSGVHMREVGGGTYMCGGHPDEDPAVDPEDFTMNHTIWQDFIWPMVAMRIPQFEAVKVLSEWAGHYAMNTLDHNAITGPHPEVANFIFQNGFSGHGLQQSPAMGRGTSEWLTYGAYRSLDLSEFHYDRIVAGRPILERAII
jgi:glycine/D-amino acid oxidase-like deaminating enzyme